MKILVVDDDKDMLQLTTRMVTYCSHEPVPLMDSAGALKVINDERIQVVISDWVMPGLSGLDLVRALRADPVKRPYVYFMVLTGTRLGNLNFMEAMDAGADDYMEKPVNKDLLRVRLRVAERMLKLGTEVTTLEGLVPVCSHCRRVRRDDQAYESLELYISKNSSFRFSHGICPSCMERYYSKYK
ncbi:MAG: response regulator transcription factor [Elusimicrobia bacterium]|nr:response regulator transcription factor [Elusimicrobiota bacterium]